MKAMNSRSIVAVTAIAAFIGLIGIMVSVTTRSHPVPPCPRCHSSNTKLQQRSALETVYLCRDCEHTYLGPARQDFSWSDALVEFLDP